MKNKLLSIGVTVIMIFSYCIKSYSQVFANGGFRFNVDDVTSTYHNDMFIYFMPDASDGKDKYESILPISNDPLSINLSVFLSTGQKISPNVLPLLTGDKKVQMYIQLGNNTGSATNVPFTKNLTLNIDDVNGLNPKTKIFLFDNILGTNQNLITDPKYPIPTNDPNSFVFPNPATDAQLKRFVLCFDLNGVGIPDASFTVNPSPVIANSYATVTFTGTAPASASYSWDLGNAQLQAGDDIHSAGPLHVTWSESHLGTQTIKLTVNGLCFSSTQNSVDVTVNPAFQAGIIPSGTVPICSGETVTLTANQGTDYTYQWKADDVDIEGQTNSTYIASVPGSYTVEVTTNTGTSTSAPTIVVVNQLPTQYNVTGGGTYCAGGTGVTVNIAGSQLGVNYQLKVDGINTGDPVAGTDAPLSFGSKTAAGNLYCCC